MRFVLEKDQCNISKDQSVTWAASGSEKCAENISSNKKVRIGKQRESSEERSCKVLIRQKNHKNYSSFLLSIYSILDTVLTSLKDFLKPNACNRCKIICQVTSMKHREVKEQPRLYIQLDMLIGIERRNLISGHTLLITSSIHFASLSTIGLRG